MGNTQTKIITEKEENRKIGKWECQDCFDLNERGAEKCKSCSAVYDDEKAVWPIVTIGQLICCTQKDIVSWANSAECTKVIYDWYQIFNTEEFSSKIVSPIISDVWNRMEIARKSMLATENMIGQEEV